jgi:hypothetical protein
MDGLRHSGCCHSRGPTCHARLVLLLLVLDDLHPLKGVHGHAHPLLLLLLLLLILMLRIKAPIPPCELPQLRLPLLCGIVAVGCKGQQGHPTRNGCINPPGHGSV